MLIATNQNSEVVGDAGLFQQRTDEGVSLVGDDAHRQTKRFEVIQPGNNAGINADLATIFPRVVAAEAFGDGRRGGCRLR